MNFLKKLWLRSIQTLGNSYEEAICLNTRLSLHFIKNSEIGETSISRLQGSYSGESTKGQKSISKLEKKTLMNTFLFTWCVITGMLTFVWKWDIRYIRFFPDGLALLTVSNKTLGTKKLKEILRLHEEEKKEEIKMENREDFVISGEYLLKENHLYVKFHRSIALYEYEMTLLKNSFGLFTTLRIERHLMRQIGTDYTTQMTPISQNQVKTFTFKRIPSFLNDLDEACTGSMTL